jgi:serine/threonine-protein kinase
VKLEPAAIVAGRYKLCRLLGEGAVGVVWEALHVFTQKRFALKFLKRGTEEQRRRFEREVRAAGAVRHENVIDVHDFLELPDGSLAIVMDLLEGESLGRLLTRVKKLPLPEVAALFMPVTAALAAMHAVGIVHRDLKPDNIFLARVKGEVIVKVLDFGAAKLAETAGLAAPSESLTATGSILGTPYYMSPEQVFAEKDLDARADIWSLGVVLYEVLTGLRPTEGDNVGRVLRRIMNAEFDPISDHCDALPEDVAALVTAMLSLERDARPRDARAIGEVLQRYAADRIVPYLVPSANVVVVDPRVDSQSGTQPSSGEPSSVRARESSKDSDAGSAELARADTAGSSALALSVTGLRRSGRRTGLVAVAAVAATVMVLRLLESAPPSSTRSTSETAPLAARESPPADVAIPVSSLSASVMSAAPPAAVSAPPSTIAPTPSVRAASGVARPHASATPSSQAPRDSPVWNER